MLQGNISRPTIGILMKLTLFIFAISSLLLSGCATMQVPEGPTEITLTETQGRVLVSYGEQYEAGQQGMALEPDNRVIALEDSSAKILYEVEPEEKEDSFSCEVDLVENSNIQISGAQDCIEDKIVSNNVNTSDEETDVSEEAVASVETTTEDTEESIDTTVASVTIEDTAENTVENTVDDSETDRVSVASTPSDNSGELVAAVNVNTAEPTLDSDVSIRPAPSSVTRRVIRSSSEVRIPFRTAELTEDDLQSIAAIKANATRDIPLVLRSVPRQEPIYNYIDTVILLDHPYM